LGLDYRPRGPAGDLPESRCIQPEPPIRSKGKMLALLALGAVVLGSVAGWNGGEVERSASLGVVLRQ
jgi:hypothetical protein